MMRAVCWHGPRDVRVDTVPEPEILNPRDAIVRVTSTAICGSDLHLFNGIIPTMESGDVLGHEFMGEVLAVGPGCRTLAAGDRVVVPFAIACGDCFFCRERLTSLLLAFGSVARRTIERLKNSPNPVVRRTAIQLMRQFGGSESLPDLTELLDDNEPQVQREAVRASLNIGTDAAFRILEQALTSGTARSRDAIMQSIGTVRDERATPLFAYILGHVDHRGTLAPVYLRAIESLGALRDPSGVPPLRDALYKGEWWAPRRTAALRSAAAAALSRVGAPEAIAVVEEAGERGSRGIRSAARAQLSNSRGRPVRSAAGRSDA